MEKNNHSNSSRCRKLREALANSPALRAIHRISHYHHQESKPATIESNSPSSYPTAHTQGGAGPIAIKFDYSIPTSNGHANLDGKVTTVQGKPPTSAGLKGDEKGKSKAEAPGLVVDFEQQQQDKKDVNYIFSEYIQRARDKLKTVSNIGKGQSKGAPEEANGTRKKDDHKDQISDFIHLTKRKIRATSSIGKTGSLKRG